MESSMHGNTSVEVLLPNFKMPQGNLSPEDWATLAFWLHAQLSGFYTETGRGVGSIPWLLDAVEVSIPARDLPYGHAKALPERIDDSRCQSKTKGVIFTSTIEFGKIPSAWEWQSVKSPRSTKPKDVKLPRARRTVHLFISQKGFFIVVVRWVPKPNWWLAAHGREWLLGTDCGYETESIKVTEANEQQLASFLRNHQKTSTTGSWALNIVTTLLHVQQQVAKKKFREYEEAVARMHRIKHSVDALI